MGSISHYRSVKQSWAVSSEDTRMMPSSVDWAAASCFASSHPFFSVPAEGTCSRLKEGKANSDKNGASLARRFSSALETRP